MSQAAQPWSPDPKAAPATVGPEPWSVRLLGVVEAQGQGRTLNRWPSRAAALLLARLALAPDRIHPREELVDLLWPGAPLEVGRNRLRQVLSTLKTLLESETGVRVIEADRHALRVAPGAMRCDARDFEQHLRAGHWEWAETLYRGELMPGFYDEWVAEQRGRLAALAERLQWMPRLPAATSNAAPASRAPAVAPASAAPQRPGQLPSFWTPVFGTELNATRLRELVRQQRLVTVLGAGGSGKTRLASEAARALQEPQAGSPPAAGGPAHAAGQGGVAGGSTFHQVTFVSLVDCTDADRALDAIATALQVVGREALKGITQVLSGQRTLLLLDNFEQLVGAADALLLQLLSACDQLHLLVTSRQRLGLDGEQVFELGGLALPEGPAIGTAAAATDHPQATAPAMALFIDRARAAAPDLALNTSDRAAAAELVRLLSGMPLAIELAASRMRSLTPSSLLSLLSNGRAPLLDVLSRDTARTGLAQRHHSMRQVLAWSWQQLNPALMVMMRALSTFAAPASVQTLAGVAELDLHLAHQRLEQLRDHSLVSTAKDERGSLRYALLQPVREYVVERSDAHDLALARQRLRTCMLQFGLSQAARGHLAIADTEAELPQVYAAILGAAADGPQAEQQAVHIAVALSRHWVVDTRAGLPLAVVLALEAALPAVQDPVLRCQTLILLSFSNVLGGATEKATAQAQQALEWASDARSRAQALLRLTHATMFSAQDQSGVDAYVNEALALAQSAADRETQALALRMRFLVTVNRDNDNVAGESMAFQVQALWEELGHRRNAYSGLMDRATCWIARGRLDEAATALAACEQVALQERFFTGAIMSSWQLGRVSIRLRQADAALAAFRRCLQGAWDLRRMAYVADALVLLPAGLAFTGRAEDAARLQGFAVAHWQRQFGTFYHEMKRDVCPTRRWLRQHLGPVRMEALRLEGSCMALVDAVALGLGSTER